MPCTDGGPTTYEQLEDAWKHSAKVEGLLCEAMTALENVGQQRMVSKDLRQWWKQHQAEDARRQAEARERRNLRRLASQALSKLSTEEVEALRHEGLEGRRRRRRRR